MDKNQRIVLRHFDSIKAGAVCFHHVWVYREDVERDPLYAQALALASVRDLKLADVSTGERYEREGV